MENKENKEFNINWMGVLKWTVVGGVVVGAYYVGKKAGAKQEALKHTTVEVQPTVVQETSEI